MSKGGEQSARSSRVGGLGYSAAGVVVSVGEGVRGFAPGERVACAGLGYASHAELLSVPRNLCARVPEGVSFGEAAYATLGAIALQGVRLARTTLGESVVVIGLGRLGSGRQLSRTSVAASSAWIWDAGKIELSRSIGRNGLRAGQGRGGKFSTARAGGARTPEVFAPRAVRTTRSFCRAKSAPRGCVVVGQVTTTCSETSLPARAFADGLDVLGPGALRPDRGARERYLCPTCAGRRGAPRAFLTASPRRRQRRD